LWLNRIRYEEVLVLGDSHALVFNNRLFRSKFPKFFFNVIAVLGATVTGMTNPNSKTQASSIFLQHLGTTKAKVTIILLGEVDTGFVIWYRAEKYNLPVSQLLVTAIEDYKNIINRISTFTDVICIEAPLPTIQDGQHWGEVANLRSAIKASQLQRTELTIEFNEAIKEFCFKKHITHLSFKEESIGSNGLVLKSLLNADPNNHHYCLYSYANVIIEKLKKHLVF
jgi:hypothetical protein